MEKVTLLIPAYNEEGTIRRSAGIGISMMKRGYVHDVIVVDDGSTDRTAERAAIWAGPVSDKAAGTATFLAL